MGFLWKYMQKYWKGFLAAALCLTAEAFCDLLQPTIMSWIVDVGIAEKRIDYVLHMGAVMLGITGVGAVAAAGRNIISSNISQRFGSMLRLDLFKKVQSFSFEGIDHFEGASLVTRLTNDVTQVQNLAHGLMRVFVKAPLLCIGGLVMATLLNPSMAVVLLIVVPAIALLIFFSMRIGYPFFMKVQNSLDKVNGVMREYLAGVRVVKAFNRFDYETDRFHKANDDLTAASTRAMRVMTAFNPAITLAVNLGIAAVLWFGGVKVNNGSVHVGQIIAFINYMTQILSSIIMISFIFNMLVRARASAERIGEVMAWEDRMKTPEETVGLSDAKGRVEYDHVSFSYEGAGAEQVLKHICFECGSGETVGIIGSTGSGKTSLVNLLPRFYDATSGTVRVDGVDIRDADLKILREKIAVVPQKSMLFTGSILENIRWGNEACTLEEAEQAARIAQAHEFIAALPEGYDTLLGQGGVNLSGGQKQRISIARALVRKPEILILDDCTSAVDVATEARIREGLKSYFGSLTCLIIAQRITSVMEADKILVLDNGTLAGAGAHHTLLKSCEVYKDIYRSQIGREAV